MAWTAITEADVLANLNDAEVQTFREKIRDDQADPLATILADVTSEVRGYCLRQIAKLPASGVPPSLKNAALDIAVYRLCKRVQTGSEQQRKPAADDAVKKLEKVAERKILVEDADGVVSETLPSVEERTLDFDKGQQDGL